MTRRYHPPSALTLYSLSPYSKHWRTSPLCSVTLASSSFSSPLLIDSKTHKVRSAGWTKACTDGPYNSLITKMRWNIVQKLWWAFQNILIMKLIFCTSIGGILSTDTSVVWMRSINLHFSKSYESKVPKLIGFKHERDSQSITLISMLFSVVKVRPCE